MSERAYTVAEIDALRSACELRWIWGTTKRRPPPPGSSHSGRGWGPGEKDVGVEQLVRTYMLAGLVAADIYEEDERRDSLIPPGYP